MYVAHYKLSGRPFQLSPDPNFYYASRSHKRALAYLTYGLNEREGFIVITGDVGAGKTTLVGHLLSQMDRDRFVFGHVVTTQLQADDALRMVVSAFGIQQRGIDKATLLRDIEDFLKDCRAQGKHTLLIVDEVQNMHPSALEELRMLSNFQADGKPLLQCFLLGQPQFRRIIAGDDMEQLRQRVIASCHLEPMDVVETRSYIEHRLEMVDWKGDPAFTAGAFETLYRHTGGVPRRINNLCSRVLLFGALEDVHLIDEEVIEEVAQELAQEGTQYSSTAARPEAPSPPPPAAPPPAAALPVENPTAGDWASPATGETLEELRRRVEVLKGAR